MKHAMPWLEHAIELRKRLLLSLGGLLVGIIASYPFTDTIQSFMVAPLAKVLLALRPEGIPPRMIYTTLTEAFTTRLRLAVTSGVICSFPWIAWNMWRFFAPGLYRNERHIFVLVLIASPLLFFAGASLAYFVVFPAAWTFFLAFEGQLGSLSLQLEARIGEYMATALTIITAFGVCFQLPLALLILQRMGILSPELLQNGRKYAFLLILVIAAVITPPDIISPLLLTIPIYALYESSIIIGQLSCFRNNLANTRKKRAQS